MPDRQTESNISRRISRRDFLEKTARVAGKALLIASTGGIGLHNLSSLLQQPSNTINRVKPPEPKGGLEKELTPPPVLPDICVLTEDSDQVDRFMSGDKTIKPEEIFPSRKEELSKIEINANDFSGIRHKSLEGYPIQIQVVVLPVGYESPTELQPILDLINRVWQSYGVNFALLTKSVPIGIKAVERLAILTDTKEVEDVVSKIEQALPNEAILPEPL